MPAYTRPRLVGLQFIALALTWGASFVFIKVSVEGINPTQVMLGRLMFGAIFLFLVMMITRRRWPRGARTWGSLALITVFLTVLPHLLYAWAGQYIPSGLSSIYNATIPITTLLFALLLPGERFTRGKFLGLVIGAIGVVILAAPWTLSFGEGADRTLLFAQLACLVANCCLAIAYVLARRLLRTGEYDATTIAASQIVLAALIGLIVAPFIGGFEPMQLSLEIVVSMLLLGFVGTGIAYIWINNVIITWGPTAASTVAYVIPVVGVVLGVLVLGEVLHWNEPVGGAAILLGVLYSQGRLGRKRSRET